MILENVLATAVSAEQTLHNTLCAIAKKQKFYFMYFANSTSMFEAHSRLEKLALTSTPNGKSFKFEANDYIRSIKITFGPCQTWSANRQFEWEEEGLPDFALINYCDTNREQLQDDLLNLADVHYGIRFPGSCADRAFLSAVHRLVYMGEFESIEHIRDVFGIEISPEYDAKVKGIKYYFKSIPRRTVFGSLVNLKRSQMDSIINDYGLTVNKAGKPLISLARKTRKSEKLVSLPAMSITDAAYLIATECDPELFSKICRSAGSFAK